MKSKRQNNLTFLAIPFLADMRTAMVTIATPLLAIRLGANSLALGTLGFTVVLVYVCLCFFFGKLSEIWKRKYVILAGSLLYTVCCIYISASVRLYQLFISMVLLGVSLAMFWPPLEAWIAGEGKQIALAQKMSLFNVSWGMGAAVGPLVGGGLFQLNSHFPFYFAIIISALIFLLILGKPEKIRLASRQDNSGISTLSEKRILPSHPSLYLRLALIANFVLWFSLGTIRYLFPKLSTQIGISPWLLGVLMFTLYLSQTLTFFGLGRTSIWHYRFFLLISFQLLAVIGLFMISISDSMLLFFVSFGLLGTALGMTYSSSLFYSVNTSNAKGTRTGIHETVLGSGSLVGSLAGGVTAQIYSLKAPYLLSASIVATGIIVQLSMFRRNSPKPDK